MFTQGNSYDAFKSVSTCPYTVLVFARDEDTVESAVNRKQYYLYTDLKTIWNNVIVKKKERWSQIEVRRTPDHN